MKKEILKSAGWIILFVCNTIFAFASAQNLPFGTIEKILFLCLFLAVHLFFFVLLHKQMKENVPLEKLFLKFFVLLGIFYLFFLPIGRVPDEGAHFLRSYEISEGHFFSIKTEDGKVGREFPVELKEITQYDNLNSYSSVLDLFKISAGENTQFFDFFGSAVYSVFSYIPQTIGILITRLFTSSICAQAYGGRIASFAVCAFLLYMAFKMLPCFKRFFLMVAFFPMVFQEMISLSPDGITIALSFLLVSYILKLRYDQKRMVQKKDLVCLSAICTVLSICKIVYLPFCLLVFLVPKEKFQSTKEKYWFIGLLALWVVTINLVWLGIASNFLPSKEGGVYSKNQVIYILTHPIQYVMILARTVLGHFDNMLLTMTGQSLEWFTLNLSIFYPFITVLLLSYFAIQDHGEITIDRYTKYLCAFVFCSIFLLIYTSLYVQWTPVANRVIEGVQGRYFIPILLLLPAICSHEKRKLLDSQKANYFVLSFMLFFNLYALIMMFLQHVG